MFGFPCLLFQGIPQGRYLGIRHSNKLDFKGGGGFPVPLQLRIRLLRPLPSPPVESSSSPGPGVHQAQRRKGEPGWGVKRGGTEVEKFHSKGRDGVREEGKGGSKLPMGKVHFSEITTKFRGCSRHGKSFSVFKSHFPSQTFTLLAVAKRKGAATREVSGMHLREPRRSCSAAIVLQRSSKERTVPGCVGWRGCSSGAGLRRPGGGRASSKTVPAPLWATAPGNPNSCRKRN